MKKKRGRDGKSKGAPSSSKSVARPSPSPSPSPPSVGNFSKACNVTNLADDILSVIGKHLSTDKPTWLPIQLASKKMRMWALREYTALATQVVESLKVEKPGWVGIDEMQDGLKRFIHNMSTYPKAPGENRFFACGPPGVGKRTTFEVLARICQAFGSLKDTNFVNGRYAKTKELKQCIADRGAIYVKVFRGEKKLEKRLLQLMKEDWLGAQNAMWFIVYEDKLFMQNNAMLQRASVGEPLTYSERKFRWGLDNFNYIEFDGAYDEIGRPIDTIDAADLIIT